MKESLTIAVNGRPVELHRGMRVKHALIACGDRLCTDCLEGRAVVRDENGFVVGLDGALYDGARLDVSPLGE